ncbi:NUDIX hydrolase [Kribbella sp. NPDC056951]|uniref:NUDIX hydrolase n=1 Tax=Kribbella sp. NPDC056951 TaxID=3345978 RepID=UPI003626DE0D
MTAGNEAIAAAVVINDGRVLLVRRSITEGSLRWQFPAGKIEVGETAEAAAVRETREEAGVEVRAVRTLGERVHPLTGRRMHYLECALVGGTARVGDASEVDAVAWCGRAELSALIPEGVFDPVQTRLDSSLAD